VSMALMVVLSSQMLAQDGTATPSKGGREGIVWTGVSRCPEAQRTIASFLYYSFVAFSSGRTAPVAASPPAENWGWLLFSRRAEGEAASGSFYPQIALACKGVIT
jgi:hypothetical protein